MSKVIYNRTNWVNDDTAVNADHLNNIEQGIEDIVRVLNQITGYSAGYGISISEEGEISVNFADADEEEF